MDGYRAALERNLLPVSIYWAHLHEQSNMKAGRVALGHQIDWL